MSRGRIPQFSKGLDMRWWFIEPTSRAELAEKARIERAMDAWWTAFVAKKDDMSRLFKRQTSWDLPEWMHTHLGTVDERLMWEFGPAIKGEGHRLVITPESHHELRPMLATLLAKAPDIPGWEFYPHRLAEDSEMAVRMVESRVEADANDAIGVATIGRARKVDVVFHFPRIPAGDATPGNAAFVASETLFGEQALDEWIGVIDAVASPTELPGKPLPLAALQSTVQALIDSMAEQLPPHASAEFLTSESEGSLLELRPDPEPADYPFRDDLLTLFAMRLDVMQPAMSGRLFSFSSHTRAGETFGYLKIDFDDVETEDRLDARDQLAFPLDEALRQAGAGCAIGYGMGLRYAYIDLSMTDVRKTIEAIRATLPPLGASPRSWLLFFDSALADEWVGVHPDSPAPPTADEVDADGE